MIEIHVGSVTTGEVRGLIRVRQRRSPKSIGSEDEWEAGQALVTFFARMDSKLDFFLEFCGDLMHAFGTWL
jgi:hypothetical protein